MIRNICLTSALALTATTGVSEMNFNRIASFSVVKNMDPGTDTKRETSPEIIDVTADGMTLVYTDSPLGMIGLIDITDPANPKPLGNISMKGEPTAVAVIGDTAFVGVNTSKNYTEPSGSLKSVELKGKSITGTCDLGGQPDSIAKAPDGSFIAVAIENERNEDLNDGILPQLPAGTLALIGLQDGKLDCDSLRHVDLTGLAEIGSSDPEPEYVSINNLGETVVTLQENNHLVVVSRDGKIISHFSAGTVDLEGIDTDEERALTFNNSQKNRKREPDAVKWIDDNHFGIANEGDYQGGSRGWTIFNKDGSEVYESGLSFERAIIEIGHYPEKRSANKGVEPESIDAATFDGTKMVFVGAERASIVGVYDATDLKNPVLKQLLPSGVGPEGFVAIPSRNMLVSANEKDLIDDKGPRAHVMIYQYQNAPASYPMLTSKGMEQLTGWGAISGLTAADDGFVYAVNDSFYRLQPTIFKIDVTKNPARILQAIPVNRDGHPAQKLDMEGITTDGKGGFWIASEGRNSKLVPHAIYRVNSKGKIKKEIAFPDEFLAVQKRFSAEGIARHGDTLWITIQREWKDDPKDHSKLVSYNTTTKEWGAVLYPKDTAEKGWVGLSEISIHGDYAYIIERDNQSDDRAVTKKIYRVALSDLKPAPLGTDLPVVKKELVHDLLPDLKSTGGYVLDKVEGLAIMPDGTAFVVTDNDGVDDHSGETMFFSIGKLK
jgi:hypothetical protein